jgi:hypothetical protein
MIKEQKIPWGIVLNQQRNFGNDSYPTSKINCTLRIFYTIHGAEDVYQHVFSFIMFFFVSYVWPIGISLITLTHDELLSG